MAMAGSFMAVGVRAASISTNSRPSGFSTMSATVASPVAFSESVIRPVLASMRSARASFTTSFMMAIWSPSFSSSSEVILSE